MDLKPTTIIMLIDFEGHPLLGSEFVNNQRFSTLASLLNPVRDRPLFIISNHNPDRDMKTEEVAKIVRLENRHIWLTVSADNPNIISIEKDVARKGMSIKNVIIGGTNTSGCVLKNKPCSAMNWANKGYDVQILATMCANYQITGVNAIEQNQNSLAIVWREVSQANMFDKISYVREHECQIT